MKAWLKAGLIGLAAGVFLVLVGAIWFFLRIPGSYEFLGIFSFLIILPVYFVRDILNCTNIGCMFLVLLISIVIVPLECFLAGMGIGWIVGKIRSGKFFK